MRASSRQIGAALTVFSFALAFLQRPGEATSDTKIDLHLDPVGFLGEVTHAWTSSGSLGHVQTGQYSGYLFPMGPFFALGDTLGLPGWVVHRLWLGLVLAVAAWGVVKLMEVLVEERRAPAQVAAGLIFIVNPYVLTFTQATSVTLLGYAALPWLMFAVHRGLGRPRGWWWPAFFALVLTATGGGVNAAVTAWILPGPILLLLWEWYAGAADRRAVWSLAWRTVTVSVVASGWWLVPLIVHAGFGTNFLPFTESAGAIWTPTSIPETLRLMGYWLSYLGAGFGDSPLPYFDASAELLFSRPVVVASLLVPALAVCGLVWTRRWAYAPFFLVLLLFGLLAMGAGFPEGTPLRRALTAVYYYVEPVQFLRTSHKAGPLVALAVSCLAGAAVRELWRRVRTPGLRAAAVAAGAALVATAAWPLASGRGLDEKFTFERVPPAWHQAADRIDARAGDDTRALILPGQLYAFYEWGATIDPVLPALTERPVASRTAVPYADLRAVDALWALDAGIQQERFVPGQLSPLLAWVAASTVVTGTDDDIERSGATAPAEGARALRLAGLHTPAVAFGPRRVHPPDTGSLTAPVRLPTVRLYDVEAAGLVRVEPLAGGALVDGSAEGVAALAAFGALDPTRPIAYAADRRDDLAGAAAVADEVVVTDSNRRRIVSPSRPRQTWGRVLADDEPVPVDVPMLEPFGDQPSAAQTITRLRGVRYLRSPLTSGFPQFPEHRPFAAFDGQTATWWEPDRERRRRDRWLEIGFERPRDVPFVHVLPLRRQGTTVTAVEAGGRRFGVAGGWNRLELGLRDVDRLRIRIAERALPPGRRGGPGALAEIRVPGLRVNEVLRPPRLVEDALRGRPAPRALTYLFSRQTGDRPFRRQPVDDPDAAAVERDMTPDPVLIREAGDAEREIRREIAPPVAARYAVDAWVSVAATAPDAALDRLAGYRGPVRFSSSARFEGRPGVRASRAFDGDPRTAWIGRHVPGHRAWVGWRLPATRRLATLRLSKPPAPAQLPTAIRVRAGATVTRRLAVRPDGVVGLPRSLRARSFQIAVDEAPHEAVGIGEVRGRGVPRAAVATRGRVQGRCSDLTVRAAGRAVGLRARGTVRDLDAGVPLRAAACGDLDVPGGRQTVVARGGALLPYLLRLRTGGSRPRSRPVGRVVDAGEGRGSSRDGVRLELTEPARLVLAESFDEGWRARCDGRDLGEPEVAAGFANGWRAPADCREVSFAFGPQAAINAAYLVSGAACLLLLLFLATGRGRRPLARPGPRTAAPPRLRPRALGSAILLALPLAAVVGFVFALRAGVVAFPLLVFVLWRGPSLGRLLAAAGVLLAVAVPVVYAVFPPKDRGGHNSSYATELLGAHWLAVAAVVLLALSLWPLLRRPRPWR